MFAPFFLGLLLFAHESGFLYRRLDVLVALAVHPFFKLLARPEERKSFRRYTDWFPGFGIAALISFVILNPKRTKPPDLDTAPFYHGFSHALESSIHGKLGRLQINPFKLGQLFY